MSDDNIKIDSSDDKLIIKNIISQTIYDVYIDDDIKQAFEYRAIFELLNKAEEKDIINFHINTPGGYIDTMIQFFHAMLNTKARIKSIIYNACSAGAYIALCADEIEVTHFGYMMLHNLSSGIEGKINDVHEYSTFTINQNNYIVEQLCAGFLSKQEIIEMKKGKELWLNKTEICKRLKTWKPIKQRF